MTVFEPWNSGIGSDHSANWATTTTAPKRKILPSLPKDAIVVCVSLSIEQYNLQTFLHITHGAIYFALVLVHFVCFNLSYG